MSNHSGIIDEGAKFQIVPNTRKITVPQSHKIIGTVGAHNSEQLTFQCPKLIDGHDVVNCSDHYVSWVNAEGTEDRYDVEKEKIVVKDENMYFPWVIDSGVTAAAGSIKFAVHFEDKDGDALLYAWGTTECNECQILGTVKSKGSVAPAVVPDGYIKPAGTVEIKANGKHTVSSYESAEVNVPIPDGYIKPTGTINVTENGAVNVSGYELAKVAVPQTTLTDLAINENGEYEAAAGHGYRKVSVAVKTDPLLQVKTATENGTYKPDFGYDGLSKVDVNVQPKLQEKIAVGNGEVVPDEGYDGLSKVSVEIPEDVPVYQNKTVTENGTVTADEGYDALSSVTVDIPDAKLQEKTVKPSTDDQSVTADSGYDGLSEVIVEAIQTEEKTVTPTKATQTIKPTDADYLSEVTVEPIPDEYVIPSGSVTITENGTHDVTDKAEVVVNVAGGGSSECSGEHVIPVDELPTENIEESIYQKGNEYYKYNFGDFTDVVINFGEPSSMAEMVGENYELHYVKTIPDNPIPSNMDTGFFAFYLIETADINDICIYIEDWTPLSSMLGLTFKGAISDMSSASEQGYYAVFTQGWEKLIIPKGSLTLTEIGSFDVTDKATVKLAPDNLIPINIKSGVTIMGVVGLLGTDKDGLFDANGTHLASYDTLVNDYGLDVEKSYANSTSSSDSVQNSVNNINYILDNYPEFANATQLIISDSVTKIGGYAFGFHDKLTGIVIPDSVTIISGNAFYECDSVVSLVIGNGVTSIGSNAINNCDNLTNLTIGNSVQTISGYAFAVCSSLTSLTIPESVTSIGGSAFSSCNNIAEIIFKGTVAQWNAINLGAGWLEEDAPVTEVICSDGTVTL